MKKILLVIGLVAIVSAVICLYPSFKSYMFSKNIWPYERKMISKRTVDCKDSDCFKYHGIYKKEYWTYNYTYYNEIFKEDIRTDEYHGISIFTNEYGDTIRKEYTDYTNYPRRED